MYLSRFHNKYGFRNNPESGNNQQSKPYMVIIIEYHVFLNEFEIYQSVWH